MFKKSLLLGALVLATSFSVAAKEWKEIRVAIDPTYKPFTFKTADGKPTGMMDSNAMFEVLGRHKKVKAFVYGHTHTWEHKVHEATGIHLINLPPVAYVFSKDRPNGWVSARATREKLTLELRALNPTHDQHGQKVEIVWG